jgi:hypothetical protein
VARHECAATRELRVLRQRFAEQGALAAALKAAVEDALQEIEPHRVTARLMRGLAEWRGEASDGR